MLTPMLCSLVIEPEEVQSLHLSLKQITEQALFHLKKQNLFQEVLLQNLGKKRKKIG